MTAALVSLVASLICCGLALWQRDHAWMGWLCASLGWLNVLINDRERAS